jgi:hypothetical protein
LAIDFVELAPVKKSVKNVSSVAVVLDMPGSAEKQLVSCGPG